VKITKKQLKRIIQEELKILKESPDLKQRVEKEYSGSAWLEKIARWALLKLIDGGQEDWVREKLDANEAHFAGEEAEIDDLERRVSDAENAVRRRE
jgi:hypothetical protein